MTLKTVIEIILLALSAVVSYTLIVYLIIKGKKNNIFLSFILCHFLLLIWCLGLIFELFSDTKTMKWLIVCIEYFAISFIGISWIIFSFFYTENRFIFNTRRVLPLFIPPLACYIMLLTNNFHHLFYAKFEYTYRIYGMFFWLNVVQSYSYILIGNFFLIKYSIKQPHFNKEQSILVILTSTIPIVSNFVYIFKILELNIDITPVSFSISMVLLTIAIFKYRFLNIISDALIKVFDNIQEAIIIVNNFNKILDYNIPFKKFFNRTSKIKINDDISTFIDYIKPDLYLYDSRVLDAMAKPVNVNISGELNFKSIKNNCFSVSVQPIFSSERKLLGKVVTFTNISMYKKLMNDLNLKNIELTLINSQLKKHLSTVEELASERERNRIAQEVHDTIGHTLTLLIALIEVCKITYKNDFLLTDEKLNQALETARSALKGLRESVVHIKSNTMNLEGFMTTLNELIEGFRLAGINVELISDCLSNTLSTKHFNAIYKICKEALTNSLRHGNSENISIIIKNVENTVKLFILDDGCGCKSISKGLGLTGMEQRVNEINGSIVYGSDGEKGFNIHIEIPLEA